MISTIIASVLLFVIVLLMLNWYERHLTNVRQAFAKKIESIQYQIDDVLCDINIVNQNVLNAYGELKRLRDEIKEDKVKTTSNNEQDNI